MMTAVTWNLEPVTGLFGDNDKPSKPVADSNGTGDGQGALALQNTKTWSKAERERSVKEIVFVRTFAGPP